MGNIESSQITIFLISGITKKEIISFYPLIEKTKMKGCFSLMVGINEPLCLDYEAAIIANQDIAWLAINNSKPCRMKSCSLLINSSYEYATKNKSEILQKIKF